MNNLDKHFSTGLQNLQMLPKAGGFEAVLKRVNRRRRNRLILILSASLILVVSSVSIFIHNTNFKNSTSSNKLESSNGQSNSIKNQNNLKEEKSERNAISSEANSGSEKSLSGNGSSNKSTTSIAVKKASIQGRKGTVLNNFNQYISPSLETNKIVNSDEKSIDFVALNEWQEIALKSRMELSPFQNNFDLISDFISVKKFKPYKQRGTIYLDYLMAPEYVNKVFNLKGNSNQDLAKNRSNTEKYRFAYGGTLRLTIPIKNGWYTQAGFGYNKFTEFFNYGSEQNLKTITIDTTIRVIHVPGEPDKYEQHFDTSITNIKITNQSKNVNSFSQIVLPIGLGYRWNRGNVTIGLNGGIQLMLISKADGNIVNSSNDGLLNASENVYKTGLNLGFYAGGTFEYGITTKFSLICEPYFKTNLGGLTTNQYQLGQRNFTFGLNTGLRFKLR